MLLLELPVFCYDCEHSVYILRKATDSIVQHTSSVCTDKFYKEKKLNVLIL